MGALRFGTSGWDYEEWLGVFYRSSTESKLAAYARVFNTAEINSSFYRPPTKGMVFGWLRYSPDDFVFTAKVPQTVTHDRRLDVAKRAEEELRAFCEIMDPLNDAGKLGPLLLQLPPSLRFDQLGVKAFFETLPHRYKWAIEFRHRSWLVPEAYDLLRDHGVAYTIVDEPLLPPDVHLTAPFAYIRWHGHGKDPWYDYRYTVAEVREWAPKVQQIAEASDPVYGFFNNHYHGYAPENCLRILEMLGAITSTQRDMKSHIEDFREGITRVAGGKVRTTTLDSFGEAPASAADPEVSEALQTFLDRGRLDRAKRTPDSHHRKARRWPGRVSWPHDRCRWESRAVPVPVRHPPPRRQPASGFAGPRDLASEWTHLSDDSAHRRPRYSAPLRLRRHTTRVEVEGNREAKGR